MNKCLRLLGFLLLVCAGSPCLAGPPYNVDDPGTVEYRHYNFALFYNSSHNSGGETEALPSLSLAYGLRQNIEIGMGLGIPSVRANGSPRIAGFGDITSYIKWRFQDETKHRPQFALGYQIKIPTADRDRGLGSGATDHALWVSSAKSFGRAQVFANVGYNFLGGSDGKNNLYYGGGITFQLTEQLILGAQLYGNTENAAGSRDELAWGLGLTYNLAADKALMFQAGRSMHGFSDLNVTAGFAFTFK